MEQKKKLWPILSILVVLGIVVDQLSKWWVVQNLPFQQRISVIGDFFSLHYIHNQGAAWGIFHGRVNFLTILTCVIVIIVLVIWYRTPREKIAMQTAFALLVSGALGNLIDRIRLGYVVDFLELPHWPIFNIADCLLVCSVIWLCALILLDGRKEKVRNGQAMEQQQIKK